MSVTIGTSAPVSVGTRANMAPGVQWQIAERAWWPAGGHNCEGALHERSRLGPRHPDSKAGRAVFWVLFQIGDLCFILDHGVRLDDELLGVPVPTQSHRTDPELFGYWVVQRVEVIGGEQRGRRDGSSTPGSSYDLIEQPFNSFGQNLDLLLLQRHGHHMGASACL